jgi:predicted PurR-regulated permease PerM
LFPSILHQHYQNIPLTDQVIYDLKDSMRKSNEINDFDDEEEEEEDYPEYDQIDQLITSIQSTTSNIGYNTLKSSASRFVSKFIYLFLIIFIINSNK